MSAAVVVTLALSACGGAGNTGDASTAHLADLAIGKAQKGNTFALADVPDGDPVSVAIDDGYSAYNAQTADGATLYNKYVLVATLASPFVFDGNDKVLLNKDVMESVTVTSEEPLTVEWKTRPDVAWSDGESWGCRDFYLAWLAMSRHAEGFNATSSAGYELIEQPSCKDEHTFVAEFSEPYLDYRGLFTDHSLLPAHIVEQQTGIDDITQVRPGDTEEVSKIAEFWSTQWRGFDADIMPGSGPYRITDFDQNAKTVILEKNPHWAGARGGPNKVIVRAIPDTKAKATALENGEIDVVVSSQPDATAARSIQGLSSEGVVYGSGELPSFEHFDLNMNRLFADKAARKAFFEVVDRQEIVDKLLTEINADIEPKNSSVFGANEPGYVDRYSDRAGLGAEAAMRTLEKGGWTKGPDGVYEKDGQRFSVEISHNVSPMRSRIVEIVQSQARAAGIEILDDVDPNFLVGRVDQGDYDIALFGWISTPFKARVKDNYVTDGAQNWQGLSSPEIDDAFARATSTVDEKAARLAYQDADKALAREYAALPLFSVPSMWGFRDVDHVFQQSVSGVLWNVGEWERTE